MTTELRDSREATEGRIEAQHRQEEIALGIEPQETTDHPDPVSLCEPSFDASGRLRWGTTKY